ncbi:MAG: TetR family transcriptional regulator [Cryobacterium sp.]|nr:TetR family transcriptional regulator [Cryobacterium sp.]
MFSSKIEATKGTRTREQIRQLALKSFRERGYEATTVRSLASEAGVSLGVTNYHFPTKNHLVQELYLELTTEFRETAIDRMDGQRTLVDRLRTAFETGIEVLTPYHEFAPGFLTAAMSPNSPINPLSPESEPALQGAVAVFRAAVDGAKHKLPEDIAKLLPEALTIAYLLLALFFSYDKSASQKVTHTLLNRALPLVGMALPILRLPGMHRAAIGVLELVGKVNS